MYGTVMQHLIGECHRHELEKADRRPRIDTWRDREPALHRRSPSRSFVGAIIALVVRS